MVVILLKDSAAVVTGTICCCGEIYIPFIAVPPHLSVSCSFSASLYLSPSWILSSTSNIHITCTRPPPHTHTVHTWALTNELHTPTLPLRAWTHPYTLTRPTLRLFKHYKGREPVQTERPWKFNTPSVRRIYKQTHTEPPECAAEMQRFSFFYSHHESLIQKMSSVSLSPAICSTCILQYLNI